MLLGKKDGEKKDLCCFQNPDLPIRLSKKGKRTKRLIYLIRMISTSFSKISPEILLKERIELLVLVILAKIVDGKGTYHIFNLISVKSKN